MVVTDLGQSSLQPTTKTPASLNLFGNRRQHVVDQRFWLTNDIESQISVVFCSHRRSNRDMMLTKSSREGRRLDGAVWSRFRVH